MGWSHGSGNKSDKCRLQKAGMAFKKTAGDTFAHRIYATLESTPNDCHHLFFWFLSGERQRYLPEEEAARGEEARLKDEG